MPHIIHDFVTKPTYVESIKHGDNPRNIQEKTMLTEVDIERIMTAKTQLAESIADDSDFDLIIDDKILEIMDDDIPVSETNGMMQRIIIYN